MSPEQARGEAVDGRSDLFALGVVLYQLLADRLPFRGSGDLSTLKKIARAEYEPIETTKGDVPRRLVAVVQKALAKDRSGRYQDGGEMAADLERYLADERRDVTEASLSSYMRKLFRDDYIREMARIKRFRAFSPPAVAPPERTAMGGGRPETADDLLAGAHAEPTRVEPIDERLFDNQSLSLAAGYDGSESALDDLEIDIDVMVHPTDGSAEQVAATEDDPPGLNDGSFADFDVAHADQPETLAMSSTPSSTRSDVRDPDPSAAASLLPATPGRPRSKRRVLTEMETAILVLVAALGVAVVVGAYWYATTVEIVIDDLQASRLAPRSAPASPEPNDRTP
jgi:serine/threonine protein kinase